MKTIAFFISDHGFGHASRNIPIIRYILEVNKDIRLIIKTGKLQGEFIKDCIAEFLDRVDIYFEPMDIGLVLKEGTLDIDVPLLENKVQEYINTFHKKIDEEINFLQYNKVDLVVSDIVPWIFKSTNKLNIKSLLISNFTWVDIYKEHLSKEIVHEYLSCYDLANKTILYDLYNEEMKSYLNNFEEVSVVCRNYNKEEISKIKSSYKKQAVFLSVGRSVNLHNVVDVSSLDYYFIVTDGIKLSGDNVKYLPKTTKNTHEYLMACDFIITKAGFGTLAEALIGKKKIAVLSRDSVAEDRNSIKILKERNLALEVNYKDFDLKEILESLEKWTPNYKENKFNNSYREIGNKIISYLKEGI